MEKLIKEWMELALGWKMYIAGTVLIGMPILANSTISHASIWFGISLIVGALFYALSESL